MRRKAMAISSLVVLALGVGFAGCGGDSGDDNAAGSSPETETVAPAAADPAAVETAPAQTEAAEAEPASKPGPARVTVTLGKPTEFSLVPSVKQVKAGKVVFTIVNEGEIEHEVVMLKTNKPPANLPPEDIVHGNERGRVNEHPEHQQPGETLKFTVDLKPGKYVLICNVPGHYQAGQYAEFVVV